MPYELADAAGARRRPVKRLVATIFVVGLCFCAICVQVLLDGRRAAWDHAAQTAASLAATLEFDIARNIESYDLSLRAVIDNLSYPEITAISPELRQLVLFDRSGVGQASGCDRAAGRERRRPPGFEECISKAAQSVGSGLFPVSQEQQGPPASYQRAAHRPRQRRPHHPQDCLNPKPQTLNPKPQPCKLQTATSSFLVSLK